METLSFEKVIDAPKQKIWDILWNENLQRMDEIFQSGLCMKSDWKVGGKTYFLNSEGEGMVSTIDSIEQPDQIIFKHLGMIDKEGNEDIHSKEVMEWSGVLKNIF
jgi:hypothetical protein